MLADPMPRSVAHELDLHCLLMPVYPNNPANQHVSLGIHKI